MKGYLLDVNVLVALAWPNHSHHQEAAAWFKTIRNGDWATCPLTQSSFVRISSNQRIIPEARSPQAAMEALSRLIASPGHVFLKDYISILSAKGFSRNRLLGHNQVTDAHLLALAIRHGYRLATLDRGVRELLTDEQNDAVIFLIVHRQG